MISHENRGKGISVIIPNFNGEKVLKFSLTSLANQTFPKDMYEVIVVDNASSDNSLKVVEEIAQQHPELSIKLIKLKKNLGYGRAINIGALNAKFDLILASNNDIIFHPKYLENLYKTYCHAKKIDEKIAAAQGLHLYYPNVTCIYNAGGALSIITGIYRYYKVCLTLEEFKKLMEVVKKSSKGYKYIIFPNGAGALIEKDIFRKIGGYSQLYFSGIEEVDLGILLHMLGRKIIFIPSAIFYHMEGFTLGKDLFSARKLFTLSYGLFVKYLALYDVKHLIPVIYMYVLFIFCIIVLAFVKRSKEMCYTMISTLVTNFKIMKKIKIRRSGISTLKMFDFDYVVNYSKIIKMYFCLSNHISIVIKNVLENARFKRR